MEELIAKRERLERKWCGAIIAAIVSAAISVFTGMMLQSVAAFAVFGASFVACMCYACYTQIKRDNLSIEISAKLAREVTLRKWRR